MNLSSDHDMRLTIIADFERMDTNLCFDCVADGLQGGAVVHKCTQGVVKAGLPQTQCRVLHTNMRKHSRWANAKVIINLYNRCKIIMVLNTLKLYLHDNVYSLCHPAPQVESDTVTIGFKFFIGLLENKIEHF